MSKSKKDKKKTQKAAKQDLVQKTVIESLLELHKIQGILLQNLQKKLS